MSELVVGPFLGVVGGLAAQRLYDWLKDEGNKKKLKENLKNELKKCVELLTGQGNLLPTIMWSSTVTSGDVKLLSFNDRTKLSSIYFEIDNYNYEAKRVRDGAVIAQTGSRDTILNGMTAAMAYWTRLSKNLIEIDNKLKEKISELLKDSMWNE